MLSKENTVNGMGGYLFKSNTNNGAIFFPAVGWYNKNGLQELETAGCYWSRYNPYTYAPNWAYIMAFRYGEMGSLYQTGLNRHNGCTIRSVYVGQE